MLRLTDSEKAMLDGRDGKARQKAMELLVRYADAGRRAFRRHAECRGRAGLGQPIPAAVYAGKDADGLDAIFSYFDLDSDELVDVPDALVPTFHLQGGADPRNWQTLGVKVEVFRNYQEREAFAARHDVTILKTCTPYSLAICRRRASTARGWNRPPSSLRTPCSARARIRKGEKAPARRC